MESNSDLEAQITSDLEAEIGNPRHKLRIAQAQIEIHLGPGGTNHLGPGHKSLRTWRHKLDSNSDLEEQIGNLPLRTWRHKLKSNSDLEAQITSDLEAQIDIRQAQIENRPGTN